MVANDADAFVDYCCRLDAQPLGRDCDSAPVASVTGRRQFCDPSMTLHRDSTLP